VRNRRFQIKTVLAVVWVFVVVAAYYVAHKPFAVSTSVSLSRALAGAAGAALVVALGTGTGLSLVQRLNLPPLERLVWAAAVGLGVVSLVGLGLGAVGLLRPWPLWLLTLAGLAATCRRLWRALSAGWSDSTWRPRGRFEACLAVYCGLMLAAALVWALAPPTAWDGLVYHLTGPKLYLAARRISHPLDLPYLGFPQMVGMLFTWGMGLAGERAAAPIHWFYGVLGVLALVTAGRRWLGGAAGWLAAAVLLSARSIVLLAGWPYVDLALLAYATLAFLALARFCEGEPQVRRWLILSGVLAGLALSIKYTALALLLALVAVLLVACIRAPRPFGFAQGRSVLCNSLLLCAAALVVWSPWLIKNSLLTGNPTYPFFFGGTYWDAWRAWWYDRPGTGLAYSAPWALLVAPWDATIWGVEGADFQGLPSYEATIGPLFLAVLPLTLLVWRRLPPARRRWLGQALVCCGVLYGFWLWGVARTALLIQTRLLFPAFGLLALMVGAVVEGLAGLRRQPLNLEWLVRVTIVGVLTLMVVGTFLSVVGEQPLRVLLGFESREDFLARRLGWHYVAIDYANQELSPDATVLLLWEPRSYYCQVECWPDALLDRWLHTTHVHGYDAQAIADAWRADGVTHVLLYRAGYEAIAQAGFDPVTEADQETLTQLLSEEMVLVEDFGGVYELYCFPEEKRS
jgi:hypothetical protein